MSNKVLCVKKDTVFEIGKWYEVTKETKNRLVVYCDNIYGGGWEFHKSDNIFITEQEYRKRKLQKLNTVHN